MSLNIILLALLTLFFFYTSYQKKKNKKEILMLIFTFGLIVYYHYTESPVNIKISSSGIILENRPKGTKPRYGRNKVTNKMKKIVASSQNWKCATCLNILDATYETDHIIPLYKGGSNDILNLQALCRNCHGKKTLNDSL